MTGLSPVQMPDNTTNSGTASTVTVSEGPGGWYIVTPADKTTLRALERAVGPEILSRIVRRGEMLFLPADLLNAALQRLSPFSPQLTPEVSALLRSESEAMTRAERARAIALGMDLPTARAALSEMEDIDYLDPHQLEAIALASHPDTTGMCLFDEQGLGKTVTALVTIRRLRETEIVSHALVVAPKAMQLEWAHDAGRFLPPSWDVVTVTGDATERAVALRRPATVYVASFEGVVAAPSAFRELLLRGGGASLLVVDESYFVKNPDARRTRAVRRIREAAARCLVLCGTPAPNRASDIVEQFNIADGGTTFGHVTIPVDQDVASAVIRDTLRTAGVFVRRLKSDVFPEMPAKTFHRVLVPMQPVQRALYTEALTGLVTAVRGATPAAFLRDLTHYLARRSALLQICSAPDAVASPYTEIPAKIVALDAILEDLIERRGEKVVIWSYYTRSISRIAARYDRYGLVRIDGSVSDLAARREAVRSFQSDDQTRVFVGNPAAAGMGLTLTAARYAVYESMSNQAAHYLQSLDRIHRRGQTRQVESTVLLCSGTLELTEYARLTAKEAAAQELLGDNASPPITRETMLADLEDAVRLLETNSEPG